MTEKVIAIGNKRRTREDILEASSGWFPVA